MKKRYIKTFLSILIILFFSSNILFSLEISSPVNEEILSGQFTIQGTLASTEGIKNVSVKVAEGTWNQANGRAIWNYSINYRDIVLGYEWRYDYATGRMEKVYITGVFYGDLHISVAAFNDNNQIVDQQDIIVAIIPEMPVSSVESGYYNDDVTITFTAQPDVNIYYTLDGSDPAVYGSAFSNPFTLTANETEQIEYVVRAVTECDGYFSEELVLNYIIDKTGAPIFSIQYYSDSELMQSMGNNPYFKEGTYYLKITANKVLMEVPFIRIDAQGTNNDVDWPLINEPPTGITSWVNENDYVFERHIISDIAATGSIVEDIMITGTDLSGVTATGVSPMNEMSKAAFIDTIPPTAGTIEIVDYNGYTNDPTPELLISSEGAAYMRFAYNELEFVSIPGPVWQDYSASYTQFSISTGGDGYKTIWVEFMDEAGNVQWTHANDMTYYDSTIPAFDIEYFEDPQMIISFGENPYLKTGIYYLKITTNKILETEPVLYIDAEGAVNDVTEVITEPFDNAYRYTRIILPDNEAIGEIKEEIRINGRNPNNQDYAAFTDTNAPVIIPITDIPVRNQPIEITAIVTDGSPIVSIWEQFSGSGIVSFTPPDDTTTIIEGPDFDDSYGIRFTAEDAAGNSNNTTFYLNWDKEPPEIPSVSSPTETNNTQPTWSWNDVDGAELYRYSFTDNINWIETTEFEYIPDTPLSEGTYTLFVQSADSLRNWSNSGTSTTEIDISSPEVTNVYSTNENRTYIFGEIIEIKIEFNEVVYTTGTPQLILETGDTDRIINCTDGSETNTLTFSYTIQSRDMSYDLDYVDVNSLIINGTIHDMVGNDADLVLPAPGENGSLGYNNNIRIDTTYILTITTNNDLNYTYGTTIPEIGNISVFHGEAIDISAIVNEKFGFIRTFDNWNVVTGIARFGNSTLTTTTVTLEYGDATIQANFEQTEQPFSPISVTPGNKQVTLGWNPIPLAESYTLIYTDDGTEPSDINGIQITVTSPYSLAGVQNGHLYKFLVKAHKTGELDMESSIERAIPLSPFTLSPRVIGEHRQIRVEWNDNIPGNEYYIVLRSLNKDGTYTQITSTTGSYYIDTAVEDHKWYFYKIQLLGDYRVSEANGSQTVPFYLQSPSLVASCNTPSSWSQDVFVRDNYAYIADSYGLQIINIANITAPTIVGSYNAPESGDKDIYVSENYAYIADSFGLRIFNISDPSSPILASSYSAIGNRKGVHVMVIMRIL